MFAQTAVKFIISIRSLITATDLYLLQLWLAADLNEYPVPACPRESPLPPPAALQAIQGGFRRGGGRLCELCVAWGYLNTNNLEYEYMTDVPIFSTIFSISVGGILSFFNQRNIFLIHYRTIHSALRSHFVSTFSIVPSNYGMYKKASE